MLEGLVAWVLNNYLGKYVENLNTDQLSIALLSGEVELENLPLKKDALRHLGLPIEIKAGFIGKVKLQVPVRQIRSAAWVIIIEQLYVVVSPLSLEEWDPLVEEAALQELKLSALDALEARWRLETESKDSTYYASTYSSWLNFGTGVMTDIIENLELKILNVHIRYEDRFSINGKTAAFGLTMDYLTVHSCDSNWVPGFSHWNSSDASFKVLEMNNLAIYWIDVEDQFSKMTVEELALAMSQNKNNGFERHFILPPVSARAHIKRNRSCQPLRSVNKPRIICDLQLEEVLLTLTDWQYEQIVKCIRGLDDMTRLRKYRLFRPNCSVQEDPKSWWLYAISCHFPQQPAICQPAPTWTNSLKRAKENVAYVKLYSKILLTPAITLTADNKKLKDSVEWHRSFEELKVLREIAMKSVPIPNRNTVTNPSNQAPGRSVLVSWFPQWMGWYSPEVTSENTSETTEPTPLEGEILEALKDSVENNTLLKRDAVFGQFNFTLKSGSLTLCSSQENNNRSRVPRIELQFKNVSLNVLSRPRTCSYLIELSLGALYLHDKLTSNSLFPVLVGPPGVERLTQLGKNRGLSSSPRVSSAKLTEENESLFYLAYERKPENTGADYRLNIVSKSLDVVYQPLAVKWLTEFLILPHQRLLAQKRIEDMKMRTKKELIKNWEQILDGRMGGRKNWNLQFDISAPQIIFVEDFTDPNSAMAVIDFGRLQLSNSKDNVVKTEVFSLEIEDDETFMTPCSTPPGSEASHSETISTHLPEMIENLDEESLHRKLYDCYSIEMTDLQILVGRAKDNWRYAHNRGSSTLHVLDRFNITLQMEHRIVHTSDPLYPSLTLNANLPKLVAHVNEQKVAAARGLIEVIRLAGLPSPFNTPSDESPDGSLMNQDDENSESIDTNSEQSRLLIFQFTVGQFALEVQSRGRSIAELQVAGVKAALISRSIDINITLSVHSLLLVDALQTYGPDFELLVASHKHVGMDSTSGSLRDSEPTSPVSPSSPDPNISRTSATSPIALTQALSTLATSPLPTFSNVSNETRRTFLDAEALITIEILLVSGMEPMHIANIQFNNLDIIANQETIVELLGFVQRVFPQLKAQNQSSLSSFKITEAKETDLRQMCRIEVTFDFHRLNVLLLRGTVKDGCLVAKKIATATMSEAKIQATVDNEIVVEGSLGGLQVLDLIPEEHLHQRIVSVGRDPLFDTPHPLYAASTNFANEDNRRAFSFKVNRKVNVDQQSDDVADVTIRMASVWYVHSPQFLTELQSCATEFKQYLANLARSIRSAATDMALGLVHARLSASLYGSAISLSEIMTPKKRSRQSSFVDQVDGSIVSSARETCFQTPYSPADSDDFCIDIRLDIELDSPVVVLPRTAYSTQVFVAHLGKIFVNNNSKESTPQLNDCWDNIASKTEYYNIEVRDMNLFSLETSSRRSPGTILSKSEVLYACDTLAIPILHNTVLRLNVEREVFNEPKSRPQSLCSLLDGDDEENEFKLHKTICKENIQVSGCVVNSLKVSLTRNQYEQLLDTWQGLINSSDNRQEQTESTRSTLADIREEDTGVTTLNMDPHIRAKLFPTVGTAKPQKPVAKNMFLKVSFELPEFIIELRGDTGIGEQALVDLSFQDFLFNYEKSHMYETNVEVSLRSVTMEDLLQPADSRQRTMVVSSWASDAPNNTVCISRSCPDIFGQGPINSSSHGSLPDHLEASRVLGINPNNFAEEQKFIQKKRISPSTPPPSPDSRKHKSQNNLVLISSLLVDPLAPNFKSNYNSVSRSTSVDFSCLDLVVSVESWVVVIDFFSAVPSIQNIHPNTTTSASDYLKDVRNEENTETNISVRSLTMMLVCPDHDIARANISKVDLSIKTNGLRKEVEGKLGSMSLLDLTLQGQLYRERFLTSGKQALNFIYVRHAPNEIPDYDAQLKLEMSSVFYIHTKKFVVEIQAFFQHFTQLQSVMQSIHAATSGQKTNRDGLRLSLVVKAKAPLLLLPVSSTRSDLLIADLGKFVLTNQFKLCGDPGTISAIRNRGDRKCLLDVMQVDVQNVNLYTGFRTADSTESTNCFKLGSYTISKKGTSLLTEKCHLKIQIERNLDSYVCHNVPDMSVHGELSTLDVALDLTQYRLIKDLLSQNLGENTEYILPSVPFTPILNLDSTTQEVWVLSSLKFDLSNVILRLQVQHVTQPLARINFIKSRLTVDSFSNLSQDVDLVSQEILIMDTRFLNSEHGERSNVFINILQPINFTPESDIVQAEVHSRRRQDHLKFTILLNNMRLMAVFDWWDAARKYILENDQDVQWDSRSQVETPSGTSESEIPFEVKLNITDSEIVVVENTSKWDTNAVILKSTTVISYKPSITEKPLSCNLNNCEMYSCVLGMEDETALSIIDPVTLNMEINKDSVLEVLLMHLTVRLSYHDMKMFLQILNSLPEQMLQKSDLGLQPVGFNRQVSKLQTLGFEVDDCIKALKECDQKLEDAALWLTQNAIPNSSSLQQKNPLGITAVEVKADCIFLCIIDDCGDVDVPLLEFSLAQLNLRQRIEQIEVTSNELAPVEGALECKMSVDYYNRVLSGWEPILEPWKCAIVWDHVLTSSLTRNRLQLCIESQELLNVNVTGTLLELYKQVKSSWVQDYYENRNPLDQTSYRQRSPFVPFALKNDSGSPLYFTTLITDSSATFSRENSMEVTDQWLLVAPGQTVPFSFRSHDKRRHGDSHRLRMHQLGVKVEGWKSVSPVTVDKVGIFFRHAWTEYHQRNSKALRPMARIVFDVSLEGTARKLVTVRSSLVVINKLKESVEVKMEYPVSFESDMNPWPAYKTIAVNSGESIPIPLIYARSNISIRPIDSEYMFTYCTPCLNWGQVTRSNENLYQLGVCYASRDQTYRFCAEIKRENYPADRTNYENHPAHTISLLPTMLLVNLLPVDLNYKFHGGNGRLSPGNEASIIQIDPERIMELNVHLENFPVSSALIVPAGCTAGFSCRVRLEDPSGRRLFLQAVVTPNCDAKIKITIFAPYWIINKSGLPLVFRQGGVTAETAGQFEEHEIARMVAPLLFSFSDPDASPTVVARVGNAIVPNGNAQWCQNFNLQRGVKVRKLRVSLKDGKPDVVYLIGIEVMTGKERYRSTSIVTISPRYQLHNRSSFRLLFSQKCFATTLTDPLAQDTHLEIVPDCSVPFHWPRLEKEQLLCVLICDIEDCCWSGGLRIDRNDSMHVNIRDIHNRMYFIRMEVVMQGATIFVVFTDADTLPPPIRVDNYSEVPISFAQSTCKESSSVARAHTSVPYAWDQPTKPSYLTITVPGGVSHTYDMNLLGDVAGLTYENFIYVAFTGTFKHGSDVLDPLDVESQQLVLDVTDGHKVILARKRQGERSQLWRMTTTGQLQHEGSSPPSHPQHPRSDNVFVLDIEGPAPQPNCYTRLMLRRPNPRRRSTQTWRFTEEGKLCCAHSNMCVQAQDGFFGLRQGSAAVLGMPQSSSFLTMENGLPLEQAVSRQRLRPGSGFLSVEIQTDGPTRVLIVRDSKERKLYATPDERDWGTISSKQRPKLIQENDGLDNELKEQKEMQFTVRLVGLGVSVISRKPPEELIFARFKTIVGEMVLTGAAKTFCISVKDIQCDNQLFDTPVPVMLYVTPPSSRNLTEGTYKLPALEVTAEIQPTNNENAVIFKHLVVRLKKLTVNLEEKLLLKLCVFAGVSSKKEELSTSITEGDFEMQRMLTEVSAAHAKRYYFGILQLAPDQIKLSMKTANKLPVHLQTVKRKLGFTFIKFEDAAVELQPFIKKHPFETGQILINSIMKHFKDELIWQAGIILGSTDFLGNPLGFVNDVSEGVSDLIYEGSVGSLVKNVTHGISNSAAKVTESLSDGLGKVTMDEEHEEMRQRIRQVESGRSGDHILAGFKGLGFGILGGATGIFKQVYEGATNEGIPGVFSGIGKGLVGAVTKPVVGMLDLASETARAVRDSSRSRVAPDRTRSPRCVLGPGGLLPCYSYKQSLGQVCLHVVNDRNYNEKLVAFEYLRNEPDDLRIIVSNERVCVVTNASLPDTVIEAHLSDIQQCKAVTLTEGTEIRHYIEIAIRLSGGNVLVYQDPIKKPRVRCDSMELAQSVSQQINYAKQLYNDRLFTLTSDNISGSED